MSDETFTHWADAAADELLEKSSDHVINTGITPSGPIHVGSAREILTADAVHRAMQDAGGTSVLNYIADTYDPLRKVYPFLDDSYEAHVGKPLSAIPCPCGEHPSYADHFLTPFLEGAAALGVELHLLRAHEMYEEGLYADAIFEALEHRDAIAAILHDQTGKDISEDWSPFRPLCPDCGRLTAARVTGFDREAGVVRAACDCGWSGEVPPAGGGKLTWRVDWPARWRITGCTFEPFGKDHATAGGSWDTGWRIARDVFGYEPPGHVLYEWISLKGMGDMASSKGNVISVDEMLEAVPPEVLRFLILDRQPRRAIELDPGQGVVSLIGEYDRRGRENPEDRAFQLSHVSGDPPCPVSFPHLVTAVQVAEATLLGRAQGDAAAVSDDDRDEELQEILRRSGVDLSDEGERRATLRRARHARAWIARWAPEDQRFTLSPDLPEEAAALTIEQRAFLGDLASALAPGMDGQAVHDEIYAARDRAGIKTKQAFQAIYLTFLGTERGPRAGLFLASLDPGWVQERLLEAAGEPGIS